MELAAFLLILAFFLIFFKIIGVIFHAGIWLLSIPFQIIGAILGTVLFIAFVPLALVAALFAGVLAPLALLGPLLPFLLVGLGVYIIVKKA